MTILVNEWFYQNEENIHKNKATQVDTENLGEEEKKTMIQAMIQDIRFNEIQQN